MSTKDGRPPIDSPEFRKWLAEKSKKDVDAVFGDDHKPADFDERGVISGSAETANKTDAEAFPDELEEYTPEERRKFIADAVDSEDAAELLSELSGTKSCSLSSIPKGHLDEG